MTLLPMAIITMIALLFTFLPILGLIDMTVADRYLKKNNWYPMTKFHCFCGWSLDMWGSVIFPNRIYRTYKVHKHMKGCLLWILTVDFNGLTPYWGNSYAESVVKGLDADRVLGVGWDLKRHQEYSRRAKAGKDPFGKD